MTHSVRHLRIYLGGSVGGKPACAGELDKTGGFFASMRCASDTRDAIAIDVWVWVHIKERSESPPAARGQKAMVAKMVIGVVHGHAERDATVQLGKIARCTRTKVGDLLGDLEIVVPTSR